jgi:hypothetical protein
MKFWSFSYKNMNQNWSMLLFQVMNKHCAYFLKQEREPKHVQWEGQIWTDSTKSNQAFISSLRSYSISVYLQRAVPFIVQQNNREPKTGEAFSMSLYYKLLWLTLEKTCKNTFSINWHDMYQWDTYIADNPLFLLNFRHKMSEAWDCLSSKIVVASVGIMFYLKTIVILSWFTCPTACP